MADSDFTSADYRDAVSRMVMPYGVDRASWLAGIRAGWDAALARPADDAGGAEAKGLPHVDVVHEPGACAACDHLIHPVHYADGDLTPKDVPGAAEFRDAFKAAVPPRGADHASWVNGYCAGWIACEKALAPAPRERDAVREVCRCDVAWRDTNHHHPECPAAFQQDGPPPVPLPPATAVEEARRAFYEACRATHDALAARLAVVLNPPTQQFSGIVEDMAVEHCKRIERDAYARLLAAEAAAKGGARG